MNRIVVALLCAGAQDVQDVEKKFGSPVVAVPKPKAPPSIDGKLDDAAWNDAKPVNLGHSIGAWWDPPAQKTEARVLADDKAVYFAVRCSEAQPNRIVSEGSLQSGMLIGADTVEFFLDPGHREKPGEYFHVIVGAKGDVFTGRGTEGEWKAAVDAKAGKFDKGWTVEAAVSMKDLGVAGAIPKVWGLNICRQRPELGCDMPKEARDRGDARFDPSQYRLDDLKNYRRSEHLAWSPTMADFCGWPFYADSRPFHFAARFGHAALQVGTKDVAPPAKLFEVIYKSDFDDGHMGPFKGGVIVNENFRGPGKCMGIAAGQEGIHFARALENMEDVTLILAFKVPKTVENAVTCLWFNAQAPDGWNCGLERYDYFLTPEQADARTKYLSDSHKAKYKGTPLELYDTHADMVRWKPCGWVRKGPGPWAMVEGYGAEPSTMQFRWPGTDWVIGRGRLGLFRGQPGNNPLGQRLVPRTQNYADGLRFAATPPEGMRIDDVIIFRGADVEPPSRVTGVKSRTAGDSLEISWDRAKDNTITAFYRVYSGKTQVAETHQLSARIKGGDAPLTVVACDLYGNVSEPSEPAKR